MLGNHSAASSLKQTFPRDALASLVVFLVALPLCMGIAIASGMPPAKGLVTGIIGGLIVGFLAGSPLQVSGPAAGLAVLVFELVNQHGMKALGPVLVLAGIIQLAAGFARLGAWFRVTSPAVVYGMLAGIGILIVLSQVHVMLDASPQASGLSNLVGFPGAAVQAAGEWGGQEGSGAYAALLGIATIAIMWLWEKKRPQALRFLPGALIAVTAATVASLWMGLNVNRVNVPDNLGDAIDWVTFADLGMLANPTLFMAAVAMAFIASAETLLSAAAVDRMHQGPRSQFNRELSAQGVGNLLCGIVGALPMTGVIVRSSANVQAGAKTRASAILHGLWLLGFVAALPFVLKQIPIASLAGVLVYTGVKLASPAALQGLKQYGRTPIAIYAVTALTIVFTDLLTGVLLGFALSVATLAYKSSRLKITLVYDKDDETQAELRMIGAATFLKVPKLTQVLESIKPGTTLHVPLDRVSYIDHACMELLTDWERTHQASGMKLLIEPRALKRRLEGCHHNAASLGSGPSTSAASPV
ncbi:MFS superfamily sulfate permease-like transporter [Pseudomonas duriflava]|uniref:MFS superfamily sulfate permease-like transporter n=1 Tax=Pseudomonas duriflava TaxID=459528 RepID=A0A562QL66_9PSED|nr:SulP family inorganic anion transporter [Pseudomonas duriflava]TWI57491.1 MFS superfamily sulfate permease-like transporter [Pseudomonas duriflava]